MTNTTKKPMTFRAATFLRLDGTVYVVAYREPGVNPVAQGVFKTEKAAEKMASRMDGRVYAGRFVDDNTIEADWDGERAAAQIEINSRDMMSAHREHITYNRNPWAK